MTDNISYGVRFTGTRRSLNNHTVRLFEAPNYGDLLVIKRLWEKEVAVVGINWLFVEFRSNCVRCTELVTKRLIYVADSICRPHNKRTRGATQFDGFTLLGS